MEALPYFVLWAALIFLMMRFGCGAHVMGHGRGAKRSPEDPRPNTNQELRWVAPETDVDPVCRTRVATATARSSVFDGDVYYFCSRDCREAFEAAPDQYLGDGDTHQGKLEHSHA